MNNTFSLLILMIGKDIGDPMPVTKYGLELNRHESILSLVGMGMWLFHQFTAHIYWERGSRG